MCLTHTVYLTHTVDLTHTVYYIEATDHEVHTVDFNHWFVDAQAFEIMSAMFKMLPAGKHGIKKVACHSLTLAHTCT